MNMGCLLFDFFLINVFVYLEKFLPSMICSFKYANFSPVWLFLSILLFSMPDSKWIFLILDSPFFFYRNAADFYMLIVYPKI